MLLFDLYLLRPTPFRHACEHPRAPLWVSIFLISTGTLYGLLVALFQRGIGGEIQGYDIADIPPAVLIGGNIVSGLLITIAVHLGVTLVSWLMAKAIGGPGLLVTLYRSTAYLLPLGWLALPRLAQNAVATGGEAPPLFLGWAYEPLAAVALALFLAGLFHIYELTQAKGTLRSAAAVGFFALFCFAAILIFGG